MTTSYHSNQILNLIACLEKAAPKSCSKPKSEMCSKCVDRTTSDKALQIKHFLVQLREMQEKDIPLPAALETQIIEVLNNS
jgi:hypothetical protein